MEYADHATNPVTNAGGVTTERATAGIVIGCVLALWLIRRGFRGISFTR